MGWPESLAVRPLRRAASGSSGILFDQARRESRFFSNQFAFSPAWATTFAHLAISVRMNWPNSSGLVG
jgi:hypothetical protein